VDKWGWGKMGKKASNEQDDNVLVLCADLSVDFVFPFYSPFYTSFFVCPLLEKLPRPLPYFPRLLALTATLGVFNFLISYKFPGKVELS